jgi:rhodanese-related sulfurtransferase
MDVVVMDVVIMDRTTSRAVARVARSERVIPAADCPRFQNIQSTVRRGSHASQWRPAAMTSERVVPPGTSQVTATPPATPAEAHRFFSGKLAYETDPADVAKAIEGGSADFILVDCRTAGNYNRTHLPNAINLPWREITAETIADLPEGLLVTYCWGPSCNAATKGAQRLSSLRRQVKEMIGGLEYWIREGHPTQGRRPIVRGEEKPSDWGLVT